MIRLFSREEKLAVVEYVIASMRDAPEGTVMHGRAQVLKSIASDIRARDVAALPPAAEELERWIKKVDGACLEPERRKGLLQQLGDRLLRNWPTLRAALEDRLPVKESA